MLIKTISRLICWAEAYKGSCQTSMMECFTKIAFSSGVIFEIEGSIQQRDIKGHFFPIKKTLRGHLWFEQALCS